MAQNNQSNPEIPDYITQQQYLIQYGTGTKTETHTSRLESPEINTYEYRQLIFEKEQQPHNAGKAAYLINRHMQKTK